MANSGIDLNHFMQITFILSPTVDLTCKAMNLKFEGSTHVATQCELCECDATNGDMTWVAALWSLSETCWYTAKAAVATFERVGTC